MMAMLQYITAAAEQYLGHADFCVMSRDGTVTGITLSGAPPESASIPSADVAAIKVIAQRLERDASTPTSGDVDRERSRRLSLGFDYDFEDDRGVHRIATAPDDMTGWREVTEYANALMDLGDTTTRILIVTDTGPAEVTAPEWQAIMVHAAELRQRLWAASFDLAAQTPIPEDYTADDYWA